MVTEGGQAATPMWHWGLQWDPVPGRPRFLYFKEKFILSSGEKQKRAESQTSSHTLESVF